MGLFDRFRRQNLNEDALRIRLAAKPDRDSELGLSPLDDDITEKQMLDSSCIIDATEVDKFTTLSKYRDERYAAYEEMLLDPVIAAAINKYADDSTQLNTDGHIIWAESDNPQIVDAVNRLIKVLGIEQHAWRDIRALCTYGDVYYRLYRDGDESEAELNNQLNASSAITVKPHDDTRKLEERIEYVNNPAAVFDLQERDKTAGFIKLRIKPNDNTQLLNHEFLTGFNQPISTIDPNSFDMMNNTTYVHICLPDSVDRFPQYLGIKDNEGKTTDVYQIKTGKSILEPAYGPTRQLKLLQDSLLLNRLTKSALIRILQINVGDMPKSEANTMMHRFKNMFEQRMSLNTQNGSARSFNSPGPTENVIYVPKKGDKGAIEQVVIGGDVNVKDIVDIEYFQSKQLAALGIPKQYLNFESPEGLTNSTKLTKMDAGFAHAIMRIQNAYTRGIANIINLFFIDKKLDYVNKFKIRMVAPATAEELDRSELLSTSINQVRDIMDLYQDYDIDVRKQILKTLTRDLIKIPSISDIIETTDIANKETSEEEFTAMAEQTPEDLAMQKEAEVGQLNLDTEGEISNLIEPLNATTNPTEIPENPL